MPGSGRFPGEGIANLSTVLAWESHGQRSLVGCGPWGSRELAVTRCKAHSSSRWVMAELWDSITQFQNLAPLLTHCTLDKLQWGSKRVGYNLVTKQQGQTWKPKVQGWGKDAKKPEWSLVKEGVSVTTPRTQLLWFSHEVMSDTLQPLGLQHAGLPHPSLSLGICSTEPITNRKLGPCNTETASLVAQLGKNPPAMQETSVWSLGWEDPLEKGPATHSNVLAWRIPWTV